MDSNDATILALALGIPSATFLSIAFLLVLRIQHRQLQARRIPNPTVPTNSPTLPSPIDPYYGIRSSSDHPESSHPYHGDQSHSASLTEPRGQRRGLFSRFLPSNLRQGLLPLPEGAHLSLSSRPPLLPTIPCTPLDLPHPASTPITERTAGDSTWAMTYESPPLPPVTILGMPILQHPQPRSA